MLQAGPSSKTNEPRILCFELMLCLPLITVDPTQMCEIFRVHEKRHELKQLSVYDVVTCASLRFIACVVRSTTLKHKVIRRRFKIVLNTCCVYIITYMSEERIEPALWYQRHIHNCNSFSMTAI